MMRLRDRYPMAIIIGFAIGLAGGLWLQTRLGESTATSHMQAKILALEEKLDAYRSGVFSASTGKQASDNADEPSAAQELPQVSSADNLPSLDQRGRTTRVCLVTSAISGPTLNGGIARAFYSLAMHMVESGSDFEVTVLYAAHPWYSQGTGDRWVHHFQQLGIRFVPLPTTDAKFYGPKLLIRSFRIYRWLKQHENQFDVVTYHDHMGNGYYAALAKRQGLALANIQLVVQCHSTIRWADELNSRGPRDHNTLAYYHMEQKAVEWADIRISPSRYYLNWFVEGGRYNLSRGVNFVVPNTIHPVPTETQKGQLKRTRHLAFFGRLESRKGLMVFLDAIDHVLLSAERPDKVSFLGPSVSVAGTNSIKFINEHARGRAWGFPFHIETRLDTQGALAYLEKHNAVAILPSLGDNSPYTVMEVAAMNIAMITTDAGGASELLNFRPEDGTVVKAGDAAALARSMVLAMTSGLRTMTLRSTFAASVGRYLGVFRSVHSQRKTRPPLPLSPRKRVTLGITSHNRPASLLDAVRSVVAQDYPANLVTLVILDDASSHPIMPASLEEAERIARKAGMKVVIERRTTASFVAQTRNDIIALAAEQQSDFVCFLDDDDTAKPYMLSAYMSVAETTKPDILTDFSENYDIDDHGGKKLSHISTALGNSFAHNFFINNYGKANFCVRPQKALAMGGHQTGKHSRSPFVDWGFFTRASLHGLRIEVLPMVLYNYQKFSTGSIWYGMTSQRDRYNGHQKMLQDVYDDLPERYRDIMTLCRYKLAVPKIPSDGPV